MGFSIFDRVSIDAGAIDPPSVCADLDADGASREAIEFLLEAEASALLSYGRNGLAGSLGGELAAHDHITKRVY